MYHKYIISVQRKDPSPSVACLAPVLFQKATWPVSSQAMGQNAKAGVQQQQQQLHFVAISSVSQRFSVAKVIESHV